MARETLPYFSFKFSKSKVECFGCQSVTNFLFSFYFFKRVSMWGLGGGGGGGGSFDG